MRLIRQAAPGTTMRNRTLSIDRFELLKIPLPAVDEQRSVGRVPWSGGIEGVVVNLSDGARAGR
jgi:hypothetical protein